MTLSLTDWLQQSRLVVVSVDKSRGYVRVKGHAEACSELSCPEQTVVVTEDGIGPGLDALNAGDIIRVEGPADRPERIVVVRRVWEELTSPEF
ncbi:MAG TPA: hypothetical protein VGL09_14085 [Methylomirabilota bacterium]